MSIKSVTIRMSSRKTHFECEVSFGKSCFLTLSYTLGDGQSRSEKGILTKVGENTIYEVTGSYSFEGTDGKTYSVDYSAGVDGYKATVTGE